VSEHPEDYTFDWPSVFAVGDVVKSSDDVWIGVVVTIEDFSHDETPRWELHVDGAKNGVPQSIGIWPPWEAVRTTDAQTRAEAQRLGLRHA
jgi:hypothetical protein